VISKLGETGEVAVSSSVVAQQTGSPAVYDSTQADDLARSRFRVLRRIVTGAGFLCAVSSCRRYRPATRRSPRVDTDTSRIGFRCVGRTAALTVGAP
jgi:formylglycine-generating enzyme required for sulfatase activity